MSWHIEAFPGDRVSADTEDIAAFGRDNELVGLTGRPAIGVIVAMVVTVLVADGWMRVSDPAPVSLIDALTTLLQYIAIIAMAIVGGRVLSQSRRCVRRIGRVMLTMSVFGAFSTAGESFADRATAEHPRAGPVAWMVLADRGSWVVALGGMAVIAAIFPDGLPAGPRWRRLPTALLVGTSVAWVAVTLDPAPFHDPFGGVPNPLAVLPSSVHWLIGVPVLCLLVLLLLAFASAVDRFRRTTGVERQQLRWLATSSALVPLALAVCAVELPVTGRTQVTGLLLAAALVTIPIAIGVAIERYRLYRLDRLVSGTVGYAVLAALVGAAYLAVTGGVGVVVGRGSSSAVAAGASAATIAFAPLRRRVLDRVARGLAPSRHRAVTRARRFVDDVRTGAARPDQVQTLLCELVPEAEPLVEVDPADGGPPLDVDGRPSAPGRLGESAATPVAGIRVRHIGGDRDRELLAEVLQQVRLPLEMVRLNAQIYGTLAAVEASRRRLVRAVDDERRRLERDLHDGAQQRLVSLGISLRLLERSLPSGAKVLGPALDDAVREIERAITDLRRIAAGVRPARLDEGLDAALRDLADSVPMPVELAISTQRAPAPIESAAYYVACEAITNAVRHAGATRIRVEAERSAAGIAVRVRDDGCGGAAARPGGGLDGLMDRVAAHGGTLHIDSPPGAGTLLEALLPCGS